jgi:hypothetical protein
MIKMFGSALSVEKYGKLNYCGKASRLSATTKYLCKKNAMSATETNLMTNCTFCITVTYLYNVK